MFHYLSEVGDTDFGVTHIRALCTILVDSEGEENGHEIRKRVVKSLLQLTGTMAIETGMDAADRETTLDAFDVEAAYRRGTDAGMPPSMSSSADSEDTSKLSMVQLLDRLQDAVK